MLTYVFRMMYGAVVQDHHNLPVAVRFADGIEKAAHVRGFGMLREISYRTAPDRIESEDVRIHAVAVDSSDRFAY